MSGLSTPRADDPYRDCAVYLAHGACVCSTGYPASCQADVPSECFAGDGLILPSEPRELGFPEDDGTQPVWHKSCFDAAVKENW